ncbi:MAG: serine/threonine-protein kinase [Kofleriaceae bacterium]
MSGERESEASGAGYTVQQPRRLPSASPDGRAWEPPTVAQPGDAARPPQPPTGTSNATTVGSPLEALERDEILRTRKFCLIACVIAMLGVAAVPLLPGEPTASALVLVACAVSLVAIAFLYNRTRDPQAFSLPSTALGWFVPAACVTTAIPFFGAFSPVAVVLVLGVYFTGLGRSSRLAFAVYAVCSGMQLLVAVLVIAGAHDTGMIHPSGLTRLEMIVIQALVQAVLAATFITARISRATALLSLVELERAVRLAAHREALLLEAREELDRALRTGRGRFSDQTIGSYKLGGMIGRGAMGEVYEAQGSQGVVAIKLLSQASLGNPHHVLRFLRELRTAAGLISPHIVRVVDVGEQPVPYLVMEKLEGETLAEMLRARKVPALEIVEMVAQIGAGITAAAAAGIVHRDLKPQNVFYAQRAGHRGVWKILDFGIARGLDQGDTLTAGQVVGTPSYMAPEQASGAPVDHLTDLYALAAIAYRGLTGQPPFASGEIAETLYKVVHTRPRRPSLLADLPPELDLVLAIGMAKNPQQRFATALELAEALQGAFSGTLPEGVFDRGRQLEHGGAWASPPRASTARLRMHR